MKPAAKNVNDYYDSEDAREQEEQPLIQQLQEEIRTLKSKVHRLEAQQDAYADTAANSLAAKEYQGLSISFASDDSAKPSNCSLSSSIGHDGKLNKAQIKIDDDDDNDDNDLSVLSSKGWRGCVTLRGNMYDEEEENFLEERLQEIETKMQATLLQSLEERLSNRISLRRDSNSESDFSVTAPGSRHTEPLNANENVNVNANINVNANGNLSGPRMRHSFMPMLRNIHGITTTCGPDSSEEVKFFLDEDTFTMMILSKPWSKDWVLAMITFSIQISMGLLILFDQLQSDSVNYAFSVNIPLLVGQFLAIILCLSMQTDIMTPVEVVILLGRNSSNWAVVIGEDGSRSTALWVKRILFPNVMKMIEGILVLAVSFLLILQSSDIIELLKEFTALMVVSEADNIIFHLADHGFLGQDLQERAHACRDIEAVSFSATGKKKGFCIRSSFLFSIICIMISSWMYIVTGQINGDFFEVSFPGCNKDYFLTAKERFGDEKCYGGHLNTIGCGFEGGDCINFNLAYPLCKGDDLIDVEENVGNGRCDDTFNIYQCDFDGGDCCPYIIQRDASFGDGQCNGGEMSTRLCLYDNGDCNTLVSDFPECPLDTLANMPGSDGIILGDGVCDGGRYSIESCGFEGKDCNIGQIGQDLSHDNVPPFLFKSRISKDGSRVVVGMYLANEKDTSLKGLVKNYSYNSTTEKWVQLKDIFNNDSASTTIAMNYNGTVVAVGPPYHRKTDMSTRDDVIGVQVYRLSSVDNQWAKLGQRIIIEHDIVPNLPGYNIDITADGTRLALASPKFYFQEEEKGLIKVFDLGPSLQWQQVGRDIGGVGKHESLGYHYLRLNSLDGSRVFFSLGIDGDSKLRVLELNEITSEWGLISDDIVNPFPRPPTINSAGTCVAICSNSTSVSSPGQVQIFDYNQKGFILRQTLFGERSSNGDGFGYSISFSTTGNLLAVGSIKTNCIEDYNNCAAGSVRLYRREPTNPPNRQFSIVPLMLINGFQNIAEESDRSNDGSTIGMDVALSGDGSRLSISGYDFTNKQSYVKVYWVDEIFNPKCLYCPVSEVDFSVPEPGKKFNVELLGNATIKENAPGGVPRALRIESNGQRAKLPGIDISPSSMEDCTLIITIYLESIPHNLEDRRGWVVGNENGGYDRSIIMHDPGLKGMGMGLGYKTSVWEDYEFKSNKTVLPTTGQWLHVVAVFRQESGSNFYLDGDKAPIAPKAMNGPGTPDVFIGQPMGYINHYSDCWIKDVKVFDRALLDDEVQRFYAAFREELP